MPRDLSRRALLASLSTTAIMGSFGTAASRGPDGCPGADHLSALDPGPDVLYEDPVTSPKLQPSGDWDADPLLVSGGEAYVDGEYLYQGWLHDDYGASVPEETGTESPVETTLDEPEGDLVYPTDAERYRYNAADIVEIRARPTDAGITYRIVLNTMVAPDAAAVAIGIDTGTATDTNWGFGLGELGAPVDNVLVTWGTDAVLKGDGEVTDCSVDIDRNHIEVEVSLDPGTETWTHYAVAGIHDGDGGFAAVQPQPSQQKPGGAAVSDVPPVFDVGFRTHEDEPLRDPTTGNGVSWRELAQAEALSNRDISAFGADIDFGALRAGVTERRVPRKGYINRLYASRAEFGEGVDPASRPLLLGGVQPYSIYIPESYDPDEPAPLLVLPHSLGQNYNQYAGTPNLLRQLGEQRDAIVLMFEGRGPDGWWRDEAEYDLFEAWGDAASRYNIDFERVTIAGYSMGGHGTFRLGSLYPDLFGASFPVVPPADEDILGGPTNGNYTTEDGTHNTLRVTDNLRHVPLLIWAGMNDQLVPYPGVRNHRRQIADHGYRHRLDSFPGFDHFALFFLDEWGPAREFLEGRTVTRRPSRVTYRAVPDWENERFGLTYDGAYWVQAIQTANGADDGLVDAVSLTDGYGEPVADSFKTAGAEPSANAREGIRWDSALSERPAENAIELDCDCVLAVTLYVDDAGVDTTKPLTVRVDSTHEIEITLKSGAGEEVVTASAGQSERTVTLCRQGPGKSPDQVPASEQSPLADD